MLGRMKRPARLAMQTSHLGSTVQGGRAVIDYNAIGLHGGGSARVKHGSVEDAAEQIADDAANHSASQRAANKRSGHDATESGVRRGANNASNNGGCGVVLRLLATTTLSNQALFSFGEVHVLPFNATDNRGWLARGGLVEFDATSNAGNKADDPLAGERPKVLFGGICGSEAELGSDLDASGRALVERLEVLEKFKDLFLARGQKLHPSPRLLALGGGEFWPEQAPAHGWASLGVASGTMSSRPTAPPVNCKMARMCFVGTLSSAAICEMRAGVTSRCSASAWARPRSWLSQSVSFMAHSLASVKHHRQAQTKQC